VGAYRTVVLDNPGSTGVTGRPLGSVPPDATRRSGGDVLVVQTTG
jgi:hypothetical protein